MVYDFFSSKYLQGGCSGHCMLVIFIIHPQISVALKEFQFNFESRSFLKGIFKKFHKAESELDEPGATSSQRQYDMR